MKRLTWNSSHRKSKPPLRLLPADSGDSDCPQIGLKAPPIKYPNQTRQFDSIINSFAGGRGNAQSEDCLTLNIWTKSPGSRHQKGVLLWIHGGSKLGFPKSVPKDKNPRSLGFTLGDTNTPFYNGQYLVDAQDIIFVSIK